jgi:ATP-dependent DNA helicase RecG
MNANADGGTVVVGIEDDGTVTGIPARYEFHQVQKQLNDYIRPALKFRAQEISLQRQRVWLFETDWSPEVHQLTDGRYLFRSGSHNLPFPAADIEAIKASRRQRTTEMQYVMDASLEDLDIDLVRALAEQAELHLSPEETLLFCSEKALSKTRIFEGFGRLHLAGKLACSQTDDSRLAGTRRSKARQALQTRQTHY